MVRQLRSRRVRRHLEAGATVLDFGCGQQNWLLNAVSDYIHKGVGVDPSLRDPQTSGRILGFSGTIEDFRLDHPEQRFDVVTWLAVIEHFDRQFAIHELRHCRSLLHPQGRLLLTTPRPRSKALLEFLAFRMKVISDEEIRDHKVYYDRALLAETLETAGFSMTHYETFQFGLNSLAVAVKR
jgi:cyclopropane fatty-acyl-phospholipid synthase-like methyltransferase